MKNKLQSWAASYPVGDDASRLSISVQIRWVRYNSILVQQNSNKG